LADVLQFLYRVRILFLFRYFQVSPKKIYPPLGGGGWGEKYGI